MKKTVPRLSKHVHECSDWEAITREFDRFPTPIRRRDSLGMRQDEEWIFRGHKRQSYLLEPSIERACPYHEWAEAEYKILREFQAKARMHLAPSQIPESDNKLGWLAVIQHYGAPTRLLDFTYSPYLALYFALRQRDPKEAEDAEVWGIDAVALRKVAAKTSSEAHDQALERKGVRRKPSVASMNLEDMTSSLQEAQEEDELWDSRIRTALNPCGVVREHFNRRGFVAVALPPVQNPRLSSQQGVFLLNGAEDLTFEESLELMMRGVEQQWYRRFRVPSSALHKIEEKLFQLNIHDLSLFPDTEGLAGFVRQKVRLHW